MSASSYLSTRDRDQHIIDALIEERATNWLKRPKTWEIILRYGRKILHYDIAVSMADAIESFNGLQAFDYISDYLQLNVNVDGIDHVPTSGPAVVTPNHPCGIADGIAVYDALIEVRKDVCFLANRDAVRICPGFADCIIPVEWREEFRTPRRNRETVRALMSALKDDRLVVIFPSGRLAQPTLKGMKERPWQPTALSFARKFDAPVVPMHVHSRNTALYYAMWFIDSDIKDIMILREFLNKNGQDYRLTIGEPFKCGSDVQTDTELLKQYVLNDLPSGKTRFR